MNKMLFLAMLLTPAMAFAQTAPATTAAVKAPQHSATNFPDRKAKVLQRLATRSTELQQRQQCVQAAGTNDALDACMPQRKSHKK